MPPAGQSAQEASVQTNGGLPYRDASLPVNQRVDDLLSRMTLAEKAGQLFHDMLIMGPDGTLSEMNPPVYEKASTDKLIGEKLMTHFNLLGPVKDARITAAWHNRLQKRALETRLGIPITLSTDPRNHFSENVGTSFRAGILSQWCESLGFAALRSPELVERFADVARQEYLALGLRVALHPQIDLATEPRWARIGATFGEDADLSSKLVVAYIRGFQGPQLGPHSVATMIKHFPGGGPQKDGEDPHFAYGKEQVYPGDNFDYHLKPFRAAIEAGGSQMMPYYGVPVGTKYEEVGFAFNHGIMTVLLREEMGFKGLVVTDWGVVTDANILGQSMPARAWGVEHLSDIQRVKKIIDAGCDQIGGESRPDLVVKLVEDGELSESRLDESVRRIIHEKFVLGLFDNPFVDEETAADIVGNLDFHKEGEQAQRHAFTLLTNRDEILPLRSLKVKKVYIEGISPEVAAKQDFDIVDTPEKADLALLRLKAPFEPRGGGFESHFHQGSLEFPAEETARQRAIFEMVPTIVDVHLDRPAILTEVAKGAAALLVSYGSSADAFLDVILGEARPMGKLPFDLPSSMDAVRQSRSDMQFDTKDPIFRYGHGLSYSD